MKRFHQLLLTALVCGSFTLALTACTPAASQESHPVSPSPTPTASHSQEPQEEPPQSPAPSQSTPVQGGDVPSASGDVPAQEVDVETTLTYAMDGTSATVDALLHHSLQGYSIVYPDDTFQCQSWGEGDSYMASQNNYLSVSRILGMDLDMVVEGLVIQESISTQPTQVQVGSQGYTAQLLSPEMEAETGAVRQFWVIPLEVGDCLLIEQSYVSTGDTATLYQAMYQAMLDSFTIS